MWNPFRTEEHDFTTRLSIGDCRARLRVLLDPGFDVKAFTAPSLTSEPRRFAGEVSTFAFVLRRHIAYNNGMQVEARGALHVLPAGTLVHVRLGLPVETLVVMMIFVPLVMALACVGLFAMMRQVYVAGSANWWWLLAPVLFVLVWMGGSGIYRYLARGDRVFLLTVLSDTLGLERIGGGRVGFVEQWRP